MHISQEIGDANYIIRAYDKGTVVVNETTFTRSLIIMPESLHTDWEPQSLAELCEVHLETITTLQPELVILGTGPKFVIPAATVQTYFLKRDIGIEFMDTGAACRTYNVLMAEGRNVACALLIR
jgi:uncharacterized protein